MLTDFFRINMPYGLSLIIKPVGLFLVGAGILQHGAHHAAPGEYERRSLHEQIRETSQSPRTDTLWKESD